MQKDGFSVARSEPDRALGVAKSAAIVKAYQRLSCALE
jgi:hypothetical protein